MGQGHKSLGLYHCPTGKMRWLIDDPQRSIESASVSPDGALIVDEIRQARHLPTFLAPPGGRWELWGNQMPVETPFPEPGGQPVAARPPADGAWVALHYSATSPTDLVRFRLEDGPAPALTSLTRVWERTALRPDQLIPRRDVRLDFGGWVAHPGLVVPGAAQPSPGGDRHPRRANLSFRR